MARRVQVNLADDTVKKFIDLAREWQTEKDDLKIGVGTVVGALLDTMVRERPDLIEQMLKKYSKDESLPKARSGPQASKQAVK